MTADDRLIVALDVPNALAGLDLVDRIGDAASFYKIGLGMLTGGGLALANELKQERGKRVFLDMKLFDIGATAALTQCVVEEALRAQIPATALYVVTGDTTRTTDERITEALALAADRGLPLMEVGKAEFDRMSQGALHQGIGLQVPPYDYAHPDDLVDLARDSGRPALLVALDGVTDPRNLGAVVRSAAAFDAHGVVVPQRRAVGMTASAWRTSAGAAARIPVARAVNLPRALAAYQDAGLQTVGLAGDGDVDLHEYDGFSDPVALVVGAEGTGLSRLVREKCDVVVRIPIDRDTESLNVSVAAGIALYAAGMARR